MKNNRTKKNNRKRLALLGLLLVITVGYALLSTNLNFTGLLGFQGKNWNIYWANKRISSDSVAGTVSILEPNKTSLTFSTSFDALEQCFEFTVDAVNNSDFNAEIDSIQSKFYRTIDGERQEINLPNYVRYEFTYLSGAAVKKNDLLVKNSTRTYRIKMYIIDEVNSVNDLPSEEFNIESDIGITYKKTDRIAVSLKTGKEVNNIIINLAYRARDIQNGIGEYECNDKICNVGGDCSGGDDCNDIGMIPYRYFKKATQEQYDAVKDSLDEFNVISLSTRTPVDDYFIVATGLAAMNEDEEDAVDPVYAWVDSDESTVYYYSDGIITLNPDSSGMFWGFSWAREIDLSGFDTSAVEDMSNMFRGCVSLTSLDLSGIDTARVKNMRGAFAFGGFPNDQINFDTSPQIESLDVSSLNLSSLEDASYMFANSGLSSIDLSNWNTPKLKNTSYMFYESHYYNMDITIGQNFDTSKVTNMSHMFDGLYTDLGDISGLYNIDTSNVVDISYMFSRNTIPEDFDIEELDTSKVENISGLFADCSGGGDIDFSKINISNVTNMSYFFSGLDISGTNFDNLDTSKVTDMSYMFSGAYDSEDTNVHLNTSNVVNMRGMFSSCSSIGSFDFDNFDTSKVTDMSYMFSKVYSFNNLDLSKLNTSNVTNMSYMFYDSHYERNLDLNKLDISNVENISGILAKNSYVTTIDISDWVVNNVVDMSMMFYDCSNLTTIIKGNWNTYNVRSMQSMFEDCGKIVTIDISSFDTTNLIDTQRMFLGCRELKTIYVGDGWTNSSISSSILMFHVCSKLVGGNGTTFNSNKIDKEYARIDTASTPGYFTRKS